MTKGMTGALTYFVILAVILGLVYAVLSGASHLLSEHLTTVTGGLI